MKRMILAATLSAIATTAAHALPARFEEGAPPASGAVAIPVGAKGELTGAAAAVDATAQGAVARAMAAAKFEGKARSALTLYAVGPYDRVILLGVGDGLKTDADLADFGARLAREASKGAPSQVHVVTPDAADILHDAAVVARGAALESYDFGKWGKPAAAPDGRALVFHSAEARQSAQRFERDEQALIDGMKLARDLTSTPSNIKDPQFFVDRTREAFRGVPNVTIEVLDVPAMQKLGMGAILGVGQGSTRPPRMLAVRYRGAGTAAPIAFVGKGITFDTGGISLKNPDGMWRMRNDMAGAAASVGAVLTLAKRGAKVNAVAVAALAENMPDGAAIRPGDVLTAMSGKTIEVINTDAEGRLVLADGLWWIQERDKPQVAITIATLTGSVRTALGDDYAGLFSYDDALAASILAAGVAADDLTWRLPVHESVVESLKAKVADLRNVVDSEAVGASIGAAFIMEFAKPETRFAHIDMANVATVSDGAATGFGVQLFDRLVRDNFEAK